MCSFAVIKLRFIFRTEFLLQNNEWPLCATIDFFLTLAVGLLQEAGVWPREQDPSADVYN